MRADLVDGPTREAPQMRAALGLSVAVVVLFTLMSAFTGTLDVDDGEQDFSSMDWRDSAIGGAVAARGANERKSERAP